MYERTTRAIRVTVEPSYLDAPSNPQDGLWVFAYRVTLVNEGEETVRLMSRYWRITDGYGRLNEVRGDGVVGEQPTLAPGCSYTYSSAAHMPTASGIMTGTYQMQDADGLWFDVEIPAFSLDVPAPGRSLN